MGGFIVCCLALVKSFLHLFLAPLPGPRIAQDAPHRTFEQGFNGADGLVRKNRIHQTDEVACRADWILV